MDLDENLYRIGVTKVFFRSGVLGHLEQERDAKLTEIITQFQAICRGVLARRNFERRIQQMNAIRVIQRNSRALLKIRNWKWWRLYTKIKPLLEVTRHDEELAKVKEELRKTKIDLDNRNLQLKENERQIEQLTRDFQQNENRLTQLTDLLTETEEVRRDFDRFFSNFLLRLESSTITKSFARLRKNFTRNRKTIRRNVDRT